MFELNEEEINKLREEVGKYTTESDLVRCRKERPVPVVAASST